MPRTIFIVIVPSSGDASSVFAKARGSLSAPDIFKIDHDKFAIAFDGTSRDLAEKLGFLGDSYISPGVVFPVSTYSGRADPALWEWLDAKQR
jgi:hypothetical protein